MPNHRTLIHATAMAMAAMLAGLPAKARAKTQDDMFSRERAERFDLDGLRVWMGPPVRVTSQLGWKTVMWPFRPGDSRDTFIQLTPVVAAFPNGNLIVTYGMDPDYYDNPITISAFQISHDGGRHWGRRYSVLMHHNPMIYFPGEGDSLLGIPSELNQRAPGDERNFVGTLWIFQKGGDQMLMVPEGMRVLDWPWPVALYPGPQPRDNWQADFRFISGSATKRNGRLLIPGEVQKKADRVEHGHYLSAVLLASQDGGKTWRYFSTLGEPDRALQAQGKGYEGPGEPSVLSLADGSLMGVFRIGSGKRWHLQRRYSEDGGLTWSKSESLPAWSVSPHLARIANGTIALTTGRPGLFLWLATDTRATVWQKVDIVAHHNKYVQDRHDRILPVASKRDDLQTSSYTGLVDMGNNRMLIAYDRCPEQAPAGPDDLSSVFVVPVEVERRKP